MSEENVETARRAYELINRGDIAAAVQLAAPDFEMDLSDLYPDAPILRGVDEFVRWSDSGPWGGSAHLEPERFFDVDAERGSRLRPGNRHRSGQRYPGRTPRRPRVDVPRWAARALEGPR